MRRFLYSSKLFERIKPQQLRDTWVEQHLRSLKDGSVILDAGCGSQRYRGFCQHLVYKAQDFGQYVADEMCSIDNSIGETSGYNYGKLDYTGNIWDIAENDCTFDAILCTEVLEHVPYPIETLNELIRLLKPGGQLILTAPTYSVKHMDPYHFYTGFTNRFYEKYAEQNGLKLISLEPNMNYYEILSMELARTMSKSNLLFWPLLIPAFLALYFKKRSEESKHALPYGYHVILQK